MISFIGLDFQPGRASAAALGRDLSVPARTSAAVAGCYEEDGTGVQCVPPAEWLRAGGFALQELYCGLPLKSRKIWGLGVSGPAGWIALDLDFEPLCDLRLPPAAELFDDLQDWLNRNPRLEPRISLVLSPKDLFRFRMSGAIAADATSVCAAGLLSARRRDWDRDKLEAAGLSTRWFPPVFPSSAPTSRLNQDGMRQTGLPGSPWLVAGSTSSLASMIASADMGARKLWFPGAGEHPVYSIGKRQPDETPAVPPGYWLSESPIEDQLLLVRKDPAHAGCKARDIETELEGSGYEVEGIETLKAEAELGAAALAAVGSGLLKSWTRYYTLLQKLPKASPENQEDAEPRDASPGS